MHEVYAYGVIAPSTLIEARDDFPSPGGYAEITAIHRSMGGEAAGGAYVLARLGVATKLRGNRLGSDDASSHVLRVLTDAGVDCSAMTVDPGDPSVTEVVVSSADTRTVFGTYGQLGTDRGWDAPEYEDVRSSRIVCLDPFFGDESVQAARWCREAGVPYVTVDASPDSDIARDAEVLIISEEFAARIFDGADARSVLEEYNAQCRGLMILTRGQEPFLHRRPGEPVRTTAVLPVDARDTTGAGDSFRAGIIYGLLQEYDDARLVKTAAAVAALVCTGVPGVLQSPTVPELEAFLDRGG